MSSPSDQPSRDEQYQASLLAKVRPAFLETLTRLQIDADLSTQLAEIYLPLAKLLAEHAKRCHHPLVVGINGAQGTGKSTLLALLQVILKQGFGLRATGFSIDDIYLTREERLQLAKEVHPLLATRGVPGTHDVALGCRLLDQLRGATGEVSIPLPQFDKSTDNRLSPALWDKVNGPFDLILFEGWCVGARPESEAALVIPVNDLEGQEDVDGHWRRFVNQQLEDIYPLLFNKLDLLVMLKAPDMNCILDWRKLQESKLAARTPDSETSRVMTPEQVERFIMHYERLTRHMLNEMPSRADVLLDLNANHQIISMTVSA